MRVNRSAYKNLYLFKATLLLAVLALLMQPVASLMTTDVSATVSEPAINGINLDPGNSHALNLTGYVYRDVALNNCDNLDECKNQRTSEMLDGWEMHLYKENDAGLWQQTKTAKTDENGKYSFGAQQAAGIYHVCEVVNSGWTQPIQTWSGSGYLVATPNLSGVSGEGQFCTTYDYTDESDKSGVSHIGNVDTTGPSGDITYQGGVTAGDAIYARSVNDLTFSGLFSDNYKLKHTNFTIWKTDSSFSNNEKVLFCGNWNVPITQNLISGTSATVFDRPVKDCSPTVDWNNGNYFIQHIVYDVAGNHVYTETYPGQKIVIDSVAPAAPTITKPGIRTYHQSAPIKAEWTAVNDVSGIKNYQMQYIYADGHTFSGTVCDGLAACREVAGSQTWRDHQPASHEQGKVTIKVRAIDTAGNVGAWSAPVHYHYDADAPQTGIVVPTGTVGSSFTVSGEASDNIALNRVYVQLVNRQDNKRYGGTTINLIGQGSAVSWSRVYETTTLDLPDGDYAAHVSVVDMAGNTSSVGWTANFTVDSTPIIVPVAPVEDVAEVQGVSTTSNVNTNTVAPTSSNTALQPTVQIASIPTARAAFRSSSVVREIQSDQQVADPSEQSVLAAMTEIPKVSKTPIFGSVQGSNDIAPTTGSLLLWGIIPGLLLIGLSWWVVAARRRRAHAEVQPSIFPQ